MSDQVKQTGMTFQLRPYQYDFIFSKERYPCFVGGWGVGKTMCAISRAQLYSKSIPNNLGIIFRKTFKSLQDSTLRDFEKYTGLKVSSDRNVTYANGSVIMFRHLDEIDSINQQNINLGWAYIEQGEELDSDREFMMLFGRLRRDLKPLSEFLDLGLSLRSMWVIANAGDNWIKRLWRDDKIDGGELIEATTFDNAVNLPEDFLRSLEVIKKQKPEMYQQYVMNDWSVTLDRYVLIKPSEVEALRGLYFENPIHKYIVSVDPSMGGDECVVYAFEDSVIIDTLILREKDTMKVAGEVMLFMARNTIDDVAIDVIGIGAGIADRLNELGKNVIRIQSSEASGNEAKFVNRRAEMWWYVSELIHDKKVVFMEDDLLRKQLSSVRYKVVNSNGKIQMEHKPDVKKRLGSSPDRADAYVYGIWGLQKVSPKKIRKYRRESEEYQLNPMTV